MQKKDKIDRDGTDRIVFWLAMLLFIAGITLFYIMLAGLAGCQPKPVMIHTEGMLPKQAVGNMEQFRWQRAKACKAKWNTGYWLSTEPNDMCCDLNFDGIINFKDLLIFEANFTSERE